MSLTKEEIVAAAKDGTTSSIRSTMWTIFFVVVLPMCCAKTCFSRELQTTSNYTFTKDSMEKLGVEIPKQPEDKLASVQKTCPNCLVLLSNDTNVPCCPNCGTKYFEKQDSKETD